MCGAFWTKLILGFVYKLQVNCVFIMVGVKRVHVSRPLASVFLTRVVCLQKHKLIEASLVAFTPIAHKAWHKPLVNGILVG